MRRFTQITQYYLLYKYKQIRKIKYLVAHLPIIQICLGVIVGIVLSHFGLNSLIILILFFVLSGRKFIVFSLCAVIFLCYGYLVAGQPAQEYIASFYNKSIQAEWEVVADPRKTTFSQNVSLAGESVPAQVQARLPLYPSLQVGDRIDANLTLEQPPKLEDFNYQQYLLTQGIGYVSTSREFKYIESQGGYWSFIAEVRRDIQIRIASFLSPEQSGLLSGLIIGTRANLEEDFEESLANSGTSHIIAVSGYNITLLLNLLLAAAGLIHRKYLLLLSQLAIFIFLGLVGFQNLPALRAAIMGIVLIWSLLSGRPNAIVFNLLYSATVMMIINPLVWLSVSFQLSVAAFMGMVLFTDSVSFFLPDMPAGISENFSVTFAVMITTLPISALSFGSVSVVAIFANLAVLPIVPITTGLGIISLGLSVFSDILAQPLFTLVGILINLLVEIINYFGSLPFSSSDSMNVAIIFNLTLVGLFLILDLFKFYKNFHD